MLVLVIQCLGRMSLLYSVEWWVISEYGVPKLDGPGMAGQGMALRAWRASMAASPRVSSFKARGVHDGMVQ